MGSRAWYTTRERVMRAADVKASAYLSSEIDAAIDASSTAVDNLCNRGDDTRPGFAPWVGSLTVDWPVPNNDNAYRYYLNQNALNSVTSVVSGGTTITADVILRPDYGPPYTMLDVDRGSSSLFTFTTGSGQRSLVITGTWGWLGEDKTSSAWTLGADLTTTTATTARLNAPIGVGSIVLIGTERLTVTDRAWADSGQNGTLTSSLNAQTLAVSDGTAFLAGEELILDAERVLIRDITGNNLLVQRAVSGSTLAAHTNADIYWARSCTVERGALGTTAATHTSGDAVSIYSPPPQIEQLTVAYALDQRQQEASNYARTVGQGEGQRNASGAGLAILENRVVQQYGRQLRMRSI